MTNETSVPYESEPIRCRLGRSAPSASLSDGHSVERPTELQPGMTLARFTEPKLLVPRLLSTHRESAIIELSRRLESAGRIENADSFVDAALDHECIASAVFDGVTFPHARGRAVKELSFAAGLSRQGVRWGVGRSPIVHTVVLFAVPLLETGTYLSLVLTFASFIKEEMAFSELELAVRPEEMFTVFKAVRLVQPMAELQPAVVG